jgi:hypothetical protein
VTLFPASDAPVSVQYTTVDGTAKGGQDYVTVPLSTLVFAPGQTNREVDVDIRGVDGSEAARVFALQLSAPQGAVLARDRAVGTLAAWAYGS